LPGGGIPLDVHILPGPGLDLSNAKLTLLIPARSGISENTVKWFDASSGTWKPITPAPVLVADQQGNLYWLAVLDNKTTSPRISQLTGTVVEEAPVTLTSIANVLPSSSTPYGTGNTDANVAFIQGLSHSILGMNANSAIISYWISAMQSGMTREQVAYGFLESVYHLGQEVNYYYLTLLNRDLTANPDPSAYYWVEQLLGGVSEQQVVAGIMGSAEYQSLHPDNTDFVDQVFGEVLGRVPTSDELNGALQMLGTNTTRALLTLLVEESAEANQLVVAGDYSAYLNRNASADPGSATWASELGNGATLSQVAAAILGDPNSQEFYNNGAGTVSQ
jgi:hypothetical protein